jgi:hypothetical protein
MDWDTIKFFLRLLLLLLVLSVMCWLVRLPDDAFDGARFLHWVCWVTSVILLMFFLACAVGNMSMAVINHVYGGHSSLIPFVGGIAGAFGMLILPWPAARYWWWLPPLLDIGCGLMIGSLLVFLVVRGFRRKT